MTTRTVTKERHTGAVGVARPRIEGRAKVKGTASYAADVSMPDLAFGCVVVSTVSRGRIRAIDTSAAEGSPGVLGVIDHRTAPRLNPEAGHFFGPDAGLLLLQDDVVPYAGWPLVLVVAETLEQAQAAAEAVEIAYEEQPHDTEFAADHPSARPASTIFGENADVGDVDA